MASKPEKKGKPNLPLSITWHTTWFVRLTTAVKLQVMTVGLSLPVKSFNFDTDNARSKTSETYHEYICK